MSFIPRFILYCLPGMFMLGACAGDNADNLEAHLETPADEMAASADKQAQLDRMRARVAELKGQVERIEDSNDIKRLQRAFGYYYDKGMWDELADLFSEDASLEYARDGVYQGRERIREYFYALGGGEYGLAEGELNVHFQLMPVITLSEDGESAKGRWRDLILKGRYGEYAWWGEGPFENEYVEEDGIWKISKLHWFQSMMVPYEGGWTEHEDVNQGIYVSGDLPPDAPPSTNDPSWPETFLPPFHFDNPVATYQGPESENGEGAQ